MNVRSRKVLVYFLAAIIPMAIFTIAIIAMPAFGFSRTILFQDSNAQYIDFLNYYKSVFHGENNLFYTFNSGMGVGTIPFFTYYLMSPFNLITLLFPNEFVALSYIVIIIMKIGAIGLSSYWAFKKLSKRGGRFSLIFSLAYTLSAYTLNYFIHFEWLDALILLPIICVGIDNIIDKKKSTLYVVSLCLALITNYYTGFMICIFAVIWFIFRSINRPTFSRKASVVALRRFIISSLIAGGVSAVVLIPTVFGMMNGQGRFDPEAFTLTERFPLVSLIEQLTSNSSFGLPLLFTGIPAIILLVLFFLNQHIPKKERVSAALIVAFFALSVSINVFCAIWHGGSLERGAPARFTFTCIFFICYLAMRSLQEIKHLKPKTVSLTCFFFSTLYLLVLQRDLTESEVGLLLFDLLLIAITAAILNRYLSRKSSEKKMTLAILVLNLACLLAFAISSIPALVELEHGVTPVRQAHDDIQTISAVVNESKKTISSFCRTEKTFLRTENDSLEFLYNGVSSYASSSNDEDDYLLQTMGIAGRFGANTVFDNANNGAVSYGDAQSLTVTSLLGICQIISDKQLPAEFYDKTAELSNFNVYQYKNNLGIGLFSKDSFSEYDLGDENLNENVFANLNDIASGITGKDFQIFKPVKKVERTLVNLTEQDNRYTKIDSGLDGEIILKIHNPTKSTVYYYTQYLKSDEQALAGRGTISISEVLKKTDSGEFEHLTHLNNAALNFGSDEEIEIKIRVFVDELTLSPEEIYYEDINEYKKFYGLASAQKVEVEKEGGSFLRFQTSSSEDGYLLLTIPYDKSWKIRADGNLVPAQRALGAFMAVPISAGDHTITMEYKPRGLVLGTVISSLSIVAFIGVCYYERKKYEASKS